MCPRGWYWLLREKTAVSEYFAVKGSLPTASSIIPNVTGNAVSGVAWDSSIGSGAIVITYNESVELNKKINLCVLIFQGMALNGHVKLTVPMV